jgi:chromate transporter
LSLAVPDPATLEPLALGLAALAFALLFGLHLGIATTLAVCAAASLLWHFI